MPTSSMILAHHPNVAPAEGLGAKELMGKRAIGYWANEGSISHGYEKVGEYPDPKLFIDESWNPKERAIIAAYVAGGRPLAHWRGMSSCRICGIRNGSQCLGDDAFVWPQGFAHYLSAHSVKPPQEFVDHVRAVLAKGASLL